MLGRLFQTAAGLESATDEAHTRALLFPPSPTPYAYTTLPSPPLTPEGSPVFRPGTFDDRGELELDESKDVRVIIAQDASADQDKPVLLFDSNGSKQPNIGASQYATSPLANPASPQGGSQTSPKPSMFIGSPPPTFTTRNRSSTVSGGLMMGKRGIREVESMEETYLDLMFGATSTIKTGSSTKMHTLLGELPATPSGKVVLGGTMPRRSPLVRARTFNQLGTQDKSVQEQPSSRSSNEDSVLITRVFAVTPELQGPVNASAEPVLGMTPGTVESPLEGSSDGRNGLMSGKRPKLKQTRTPAFAIGFILSLPRHSEGRPSSRHSRTSSAAGNVTASGSNSYGSELQSSWTFISAIPESLVTTHVSHGIADRRLEIIVNNWDIILRCLAFIESEAKTILHQLLRRVDALSNNQTSKTPKAKNEQRSNLRAIRLQPWALSQAPSLHIICKHVAFRISQGLRIPRVVTGLGFGHSGHWLEEARTVSSRMKQQKLFLYNLLTAFLGTHTDWLFRLCPRWHRRRARTKKKAEAGVEFGKLTSRTVIVADQRALARRMVFLLASFIPRARGLDGLEKDEDSPWSAPPTPSAPLGSPRAPASRRESLRRKVNRRVQESKSLQVDAPLSTSASSGEGHAPRGLSYGLSSRRGSQDSTSRVHLRLPIQPNNGHKTSAGTTGTVTPMNPPTPVAYFSRKQDSYFPDSIDAPASASAATADLARHLRRGSSSFTESPAPSTASSRWGSLLSGVSGFWNNKEDTTSSMEATTTPPERPAGGSMKGGPGARPLSRNQLRDMVEQVARMKASPTHNELNSPARSLAQSRPQPLGPSAEPLKLTVDETDGVIDVDLSLPGFAGLRDFSAPLSSPSFGNRPASLPSNDGNESLRSLGSHAQTSHDETDSDAIYVAGFLRKFHPDFTLQAVRADPELHQDIRHAMSLESKHFDDYGVRGTIHHDSHDDWVDISTTLIADLRSSSIQRITLQRKITAHSSRASKTSPTVVSTTADPVFSSELRPTSSTQEPAEERFHQEQVTEFDQIIQQAIQRVLKDSAITSSPPSASIQISHSRAASSGTSKSATSPGTPTTDFTGLREGGQRRTNCRQVMVGALEEVVKSVNEDLQKTSASHDTEMHRVQTERPPHTDTNVLREGVRKWLVNIEQTSVW